MQQSTTYRRLEKIYKTNNFGLYDCPEPNCQCKGEFGFKAPRYVGIHRRNQHNIQGLSYSARQKRKTREAIVLLGKALPTTNGVQRKRILPTTDTPSRQITKLQIFREIIARYSDAFTHKQIKDDLLKVGINQKKVWRLFHNLKLSNEIKVASLGSGNKGWSYIKTDLLKVSDQNPAKELVEKAFSSVSESASNRPNKDPVLPITVAFAPVVQSTTAIEPNPKFLHTFRLRPDFTVELLLPTDLNEREAERLAMFFKAIPI